MDSETAAKPSNSPDADIANARVFAVSRQRLFEAFSDPSQLARWWGPKGFSNAFQEFDFRPGGAWRFVMRGPHGAEYPIEKRFLEVSPPDRIALQNIDPTHSFRMTMAYEDAPGGARLAWRMSFDPSQLDADMRAFISNANEENFDRLAALLAGELR